MSSKICLLSWLLAGCIAGQPSAPTPSSPPAANAPIATDARTPNAFPISAGACASADAFDVSKLQVGGRTELSTEGGLRLTWSGTRVSARVVSDSIAVTLLDSGYNQFHVYLDGQLLPGKLVAKSGKHCYMLAQGLAVGEHDIALTRLTEPVWGETTLVALHAGEFRKLPAPTRRLEVIGDSITTAYGIDGANQFCKFTPDTQDFDQSYGALVARHFGAEVSVVAWSGKGVFSNRGNTTDPMPVLWRRSVAHVPSSVWDFSRYQPDAVIINLATNDFAPENLDLAPFRRAYASFLQELRQAYPNALLVSALGPMLSDEWPKDRTALTTARAELKAAILERTAAGDRRIAFVEHPKVLPSEGFGCDFHPTKATHARMAKELVPVLATLLAWKP